jgi:hypothetical protein
MARERVNQMLATEMSMMRLMIVAALSGGEAGRAFGRTIDRLQD